MQYKIENHSEGSTVYLFTNKGWVDVVHFRGEASSTLANNWVSHQHYLDRMDNA